MDNLKAKRLMGKDAAHKQWPAPKSLEVLCTLSEMVLQVNNLPLTLTEYNSLP